MNIEKLIYLGGNMIKKTGIILLCALGILLLVQILFFIPAKYPFLEAQWDAGDLLGYLSAIFIGVMAFGQNILFKDSQDKMKNEMMIKFEDLVNCYISGDSETDLNTSTIFTIIDNNKIIFYREGIKNVSLNIHFNILNINDTLPKFIDINNLKVSNLDYQCKQIKKFNKVITKIAKLNIEAVPLNIRDAKENKLNFSVTIYDDDLLKIFTFKDLDIIELSFDLSLINYENGKKYTTSYEYRMTLSVDMLRGSAKSIDDERKSIAQEQLNVWTCKKKF